MVKSFIVFCIALVLASPVYACGILEKSDPKVGSVMSGPIDHITLHFSQEFVPASSHVDIVDSSGKNMATSVLKAPSDSVYAFKTVAPLTAGKYQVRWTIFWKDCQSTTQGDFKFSVE